MEPNKHFDRSVILSTQNEFYAEGKYLDVKLQVGDEIFQSQRFMLASISEYFDKMFSGSFKERIINIDEPIVLHEVDASAFKEIINLLYTNSICISHSNVYRLLLASDFLQLRTSYVEDQCFEYLRSNNSEPISNAFEILSFCYATERTKFVHFLITHILEYLEHFSEDKTTMEIPFEVLYKLIEYSNDHDLSHPCYTRGNVMLKLIIRWLNHSRKERNKYRRQLMKKINSSSVSSDCALFLLDECENFIDKTVNYDENFKLLANLEELYVPRPNRAEFVTGTTLPFKIENFSKIKVDENVNSPPYIIHNLQWIMTICCRKYRNEIDKGLQFGLKFTGDQEKCDAHVRFRIVSQRTGVKDFTKSHPKFGYLKGKEIRFGNVCLWKNILEAENGYIKDDTVIFKVRISF